MYTLPELDYPYDALEPYIDKETMTIHHTKHHQAYLNNLNEILSDYPELETQNPEEIFSKISDVDEIIKQKFINNAGGYLNHNLFWKILSPQKSTPTDTFMRAIETSFGDLEGLKQKMTEASLTQFGSGWGWLVLNSGKLEITNSSNQNSPLLENKVPLMGIDVWEHAYYLKYQNKRADYLNAIWNVINWQYVSSIFEERD